MNDCTPSSLSPCMSRETILFGSDRNHRLDWRWESVCGREVTMTWQPCRRAPVRRHCANCSGERRVSTAPEPGRPGRSGWPAG